jgi:ABC-type transport system involved in multi-copper enzyme maturation permease subunit
VFNFFALLTYEWRRISRTSDFFSAGGLFLLLSGLLFLFALLCYVGKPQTVSPFAFWLGHGWPMVLLLVPPLSADSIAGERSAGTLDGLLCASPAAVLLAKFSALLLHYLLLWTVALALQPLALFLASLRLPFPLWSGAELFGALSLLPLSGALYLSCGLFFSTIARTQAQAMAATFVLLFGLLFGPSVLLRFLPACRWPILEDILVRLGAASQNGWPDRFLNFGTVAFYLTATGTILCLSAVFLRSRPFH